MARRSRPQPAPEVLLRLPVPRGTFGKSLTNWLFPAYVLMIGAGFWLFFSGAGTAVGSEPSTDRALFHAVNAATMTGLQYSVGEFNPVGRWAVLLLIAGGTLFSLVVGSLAMVRILRLPYSDRRVVGASAAALVGVAVVGMLAMKATGRGWFESLFLSISAFANSGAVLDHPPDLREPAVHLLLLPLAVVGGMGVTVILELFDRLRGRGAMSLHARVVVGGVAVAYLAGFVLLAITRWPAAGVLHPQWQEVLAGRVQGSLFNEGTGRWLISCSTLAINSRSLGMPFSQETATYLPRAAQWSLILLMTVGAASAGTAGGLKINTVFELFRGVRKTLRGQAPGRGFGIAIVWTAMFLGLAAVAQLMMVHTVREMPADRVLFLTLSALTNTGLSHDTVSVTGEGLFTISAVMFAGRVTPLLILWWLADTTDDAEIGVG